MKKLRERLDVGERVNMLAGRIKKKSAPGKFYKETVQNISFFIIKKRFTWLEREKKLMT